MKKRYQTLDLLYRRKSPLIDVQFSILIGKTYERKEEDQNDQTNQIEKEYKIEIVKRMKEEEEGQTQGERCYYSNIQSEATLKKLRGLTNTIQNITKHLKEISMQEIAKSWPQYLIVTWKEKEEEERRKNKGKNNEKLLEIWRKKEDEELLKILNDPETKKEECETGREDEEQEVQEKEDEEMEEDEKEKETEEHQEKWEAEDLKSIEEYTEENWEEIEGKLVKTIDMVREDLIDEIDDIEMLCQYVIGIKVKDPISCIGPEYNQLQREDAKRKRRYGCERVVRTPNFGWLGSPNRFYIFYNRCVNQSAFYNARKIDGESKTGQQLINLLKLDRDEWVIKPELRNRNKTMKENEEEEDTETINTEIAITRPYEEILDDPFFNETSKNSSFERNLEYLPFEGNLDNCTQRRRIEEHTHSPTKNSSMKTQIQSSWAKGTNFIPNRSLTRNSLGLTTGERDQFPAYITADNIQEKHTYTSKSTGATKIEIWENPKSKLNAGENIHERDERSQDEKTKKEVEKFQKIDAEKNEEEEKEKVDKEKEKEEKTQREIQKFRKINEKTNNIGQIAGKERGEIPTEFEGVMKGIQAKAGKQQINNQQINLNTQIGDRKRKSDATLRQPESQKKRTKENEEQEKNEVGTKNVHEKQNEVEQENKEQENEKEERKEENTAPQIRKEEDAQENERAEDQDTGYWNDWDEEDWKKDTGYWNEWEELNTKEQEEEEKVTEKKEERTEEEKKDVQTYKILKEKGYFEGKTPANIRNISPPEWHSQIKNGVKYYSPKPKSQGDEQGRKEKENEEKPRMQEDEPERKEKKNDAKHEETKENEQKEESEEKTKMAEGEAPNVD